MHRATRLATAAAVLLALPRLAQPSPRSAVRLPSPEGTRAEFEGICAGLKASDDPFYGERAVAQSRGELAAAASHPGRRTVAAANLANHLLRLDRPREATELLQEALDTARRHGFPQPLRRSLTRDLALAHLQLAEDENCVHQRREASCVLPVGRESVHSHPRSIRRAGDLYSELLEQGIDDPVVRWLANLARMLSGDYPERVPERFRLPPGALESEGPLPRWRDVAPALGVASFDWAGGAVMDDFDGDGLLDLVSSSMHPCEPMKAFRNDGRGGFEDAARRWGLDAQLGGLNLVQTDYDNDGRPDLLVLRGGWQGEHGRIRRSLLRNDLGGPTGRFVDVTAAAGLAAPAYPSQAAGWADYDCDGDLDLYVGNEGTADTVYPSQLFQNQGDGTFRDVALQAGVASPGFAKGVAWGDYDDDGRPDLYVSCLGPNRLYRNQGNGTFRDVTAELGVTEPSGKSFATWFFDFDNDGDLDLWVNDYSATTATVVGSYMGAPPGAAGHAVLYRNEGGRFRDVSREAGLTRPLLPMGANFGDIDGDGFLDVYLGTGIPDYEALMPNVMYRNEEGSRFRDVTFAGGFGNLAKGHGVAFGDIDHDGDQDLFQQVGGAYPGDAFYNSLYENPGNGTAWLILKLEGKRANRPGIGTRVEVRVRDEGGLRSIHRVVGSGGSFGASPLRLELGLGKATTIESLHLRWPCRGTVQVFRDVRPNRAYRVSEGEPELVPLDLASFKLGSSR
ncbi:MAG TPA: FG-GAP-like repeat-containing protein [Thermoanaerobaculia bacterium]|nr:FG-GAP-like repeat-containing protein [Thermoanaerobaculia bacterium]